MAAVITPTRRPLLQVLTKPMREAYVRQRIASAKQEIKTDRERLEHARLMVEQITRQIRVHEEFIEARKAELRRLQAE